MKWIVKTDKLVCTGLKIFSLTCMGIMVVLVFLEVLFRYLFKIPCAWTEELARLALVWCVFMTSAVAVRSDEHPKIEVVIASFPGTVQKLIKIAIYITIASFGAVLVYYGAHFSYSTRLDHMTSLGYPKSLFYWPAVIGGLLYFLYSLGHIGSNVRSLRKGEK